MEKVRYSVRTVRPMDMSAKQITEMRLRGMRIPLSARIGRGPMFVIPKIEEVTPA